ncbi:hypothetical protein J500_1716 [Acinetobacter sp. 479375]|nr:hypothetical protein J500_1716 [Acinetobacter sp. 479375]
MDQNGNPENVTYKSIVGRSNQYKEVVLIGGIDDVFYFMHWKINIIL